MVIGPFAGPDHTSGFNVTRIVHRVTDFYINLLINGDKGQETGLIEVKYGGGDWTPIDAISADCNYRGSLSQFIRYTSLDTNWDVIEFRASNQEHHAQTMSLEVRAFNFAASAHTPGSCTGSPP
jgi:hypothetical protein